MPTTPLNARPWVGPVVVLLCGLLSSAMLVLSLSPTSAAFVASIRNGTSSVGAGVLTMQQTNSDGSVVCNSTDGGSINTNTATCSTINAYNGYIYDTPGQGRTTRINIKNTGNVDAASFTLTAGACTQSANNETNIGSATDVCSKYSLVITAGTTEVYNGPISGLTSIDLGARIGAPKAKAVVPISFATRLNASVDNTYQGLTITQPLTWTFSA